MTFTVSSDAAGALKPVSLPSEASLIKYDKSSSVITWPADGDGSDGEKGTIKTQEIVLVAGVAGGGYLLLTLSESESGAQEEEPFRLSSFSASHLPRDLLEDHLLSGDLPDFLRGGTDASLDVLVSVRSGTGLAQKFYGAVLQPLLGALGLAEGGAAAAAPGAGVPASYRTILTEDADTVKQFAKTRWGKSGGGGSGGSGGGGGGERKKETVILLSGDGGVVDLLNGAAGAPSPDSHHHQLPTIVLLPLGTGNALFHSLHRPHYDAAAAAASPSPSPSPSPLALALRALLRGRAAALPTFQATFPPGSHLVVVPSGDPPADDDDEHAEHAEQPAPAAAPAVAELTGAIVASYGFHSQLVWESDTPAWRRHGAARFGMVAQALLGESHAYRAVVETVPGGRVGEGVDVGQGRGFNYVLATMVSNLEKTFTVSPAGRPLDGVLRLVHFGGVDGARTMEIMMAAYAGGKHVGMEGVGYEAVEEVRITTREEDARWRKVCIDGTIVEVPKDGTVTVRKTPAPRLQVVVLDA